MTVIKNDLFDEASDIALQSHTSDSGGGWQGTESSLNVLGATDDVESTVTSVVTVIGDEAPSETDYFVEATGTFGILGANDRWGILLRAGGGASHQANGIGSSYYFFRLIGNAGWSLWRVDAGSPITELGVNATYVADETIGAGDLVKLKATISGTGATVSFTLEIDPDTLGYQTVGTPTDTHANRIVAANNVGIYTRQTNIRIKDFNAEDLLSGVTAHQMQTYQGMDRMSGGFRK